MFLVSPRPMTNSNKSHPGTTRCILITTYHFYILLLPFATQLLAFLTCHDTLQLENPAPEEAAVVDRYINCLYGPNFFFIELIPLVSSMALFKYNHGCKL